MPTRPLLLLLLILAVLGWAIVTRDSFQGNRRRSSEASSDEPAPLQPVGSEPLTEGPEEPVRLALDLEADRCLAVPDAEGRFSRLLVQSGSTLVGLDLRTGGARVETEARLPASSYVWDVAPSSGGSSGGEDWVLSLGSEAVHGLRPRSAAEDPAAISPAGRLFQGRPTRASHHARFCLPADDGLHLIAPDLAELRWLRLGDDGEEAELLARLGTSTLAQQVLGYGLADTMSCRLSVPFFRLASGPEGPCLLYQRDDRLLRHVAATDETQDLGRAPRGGDRQILGFDHTVPPLSRDWDGDGRQDVLFTVPGEGTILAYGSSRRDSMSRDASGDRGPDQALRVSGWVLHRWVLDGDGDGRDDLVLLEVPRLNLLGQVGVLRTGKMFGSLTLRRQRDDGSFDPSPLWTESFDLPIAISLRRKQRSMHFPSPVAPLHDPRHGLLLLLPDAAGPILGKRDETGLEVLHRLRPLAEGWIVDDPFEPSFAQLDGVGGHDLAWIERPPAPDPARVVIHRLP